MDLSIVQILILGVALFFLVILIAYFLYFFTGFSKALKTNSNSSKLPVSVIIAARNERKNLEQYLPLILDQEYSEFEVVVVNDGSHDGTKGFLEELDAKYDRLKVVTLEIDERFQKGKKFALTMGIKAAQYEHLLFTDADCYPDSKHWITHMTSQLESKEIVLGISPLVVKNNILGSIISYETLHTSMQYVGYARKEKTYMGVGRNLTYTKELFFKNKGFASHQHILSGDDDLFIQQAASKSNTTVCLSPESFMYSPAPISWKQWRHQKLRHLSTGKEYKPRFKRLLGTYSFAHMMLYSSVILFMVLYPSIWYLGFAILGFKWLIQWATIIKPAQLFAAKKVAYALPYYDILYTLFLFFFGIIGIFIKPKTWN
ncbi:MAG: transmembrane glycosyltransferase [Bacteroidetes bacterium]|nr:MAG: transmembrane glycosyltransferase [Bacteroidota bacterium]